MLRRVVLVALIGLASSPALSGNLKYQPVNPSFGGFPANGGFLLESASAQNKYEASRSSGAGITGRTPAQLFADSFQRRLLAAVSDQIVESIFGEDARQQGVFELEGTTISFERVGNNVDLTIDDGVNVTRVLVPVAF